MSQIDRRTVVRAGLAAWSVPAIVAVTAVPAAAASAPPPTDPPPLCVPGVTYSWVGVDSWNGNNLPQGIEIENHSGSTLEVQGIVSNCPAFFGVGAEEAVVAYAHNGGSFSVELPNDSSVTIRIEVVKGSNNSTAFMELTSVCEGLGRFQMKTVLKIDRL